MGNTAQKALILDIMKTAGYHITADQVYELARRQMPHISVGTVYRNLGTLAQSGEILRIRVPDMPDRFDITARRHEHMICVDCGRMSDVAIPDFEPSRPVAENGWEYVDCDLTIRCVCPDCAAKRRMRRADE